MSEKERRDARCCRDVARDMAAEQISADVEREVNGS
jgi:hypothetical protein